MLIAFFKNYVFWLGTLRRVEFVLLLHMWSFRCYLRFVMKKFTIKGVLDGFRSSVPQPVKPDQEIVENLRPEHFQVKKVSDNNILLISSYTYINRLSIILFNFKMYESNLHIFIYFQSVILFSFENYVSSL